MKLLVTGGLGFIGSNFILSTIKKHPEFKITNVEFQTKKQQKFLL